jgi:hypothetical protein
MSSMSIGLCNVMFSVSGSSPFCLRIFDMCGNFLAFVAAPMTNTNFASRSLAIVWSACSRAWRSTLVLDCIYGEFYNDFRSLSSISFMYCSILVSSCFCVSFSFYFCSLVVALVVVVFCDV